MSEEERKIIFRLERISPEENRYPLLQSEQKLLGFLFLGVVIAIILGFWMLFEQISSR